MNQNEEQHEKDVQMLIMLRFLLEILGEQKYTKTPFIFFICKPSIFINIPQKATKNKDLLDEIVYNEDETSSPLSHIQRLARKSCSLSHQISCRPYIFDAFWEDISRVSDWRN